MIPAVRIPADAQLRSAVDIKLKSGWQFDASRRVFLSEKGETFTPGDELPKNSRIVHKTPAILAASRRKDVPLSDPEKELLRHLQVILPATHSPAAWVKRVQQWPCVTAATPTPEVSLPGGGLVR